MIKHKVVIIGSTGSIGEQALEVISHHSERFQVVGLGAGRNVKRLVEQARQFRPRAVAIGEQSHYPHLRQQAGSVETVAGEEGLCYLASLEEADLVLVAVSGAVGILPTTTAIKAGKTIALANKETLVAAGDLVMKLAGVHGVAIIPVDSEHSAIFQCIRDEGKYLKNIWLTASGGPFRDYRPQELSAVTADMALQHPNWNMGKKITIDSATLMNKGLEVIEAHHLFGVDYDRIRVVIHRQSIIHSMVEFIDGAFIAHLGVPDMRIPIQYALTYPERWDSPALSLNPVAAGQLQFEEPDTSRFPALELAFAAGKKGGTLPAVMNAANEEAVNCFLRGRIGFLEIPEKVARVMELHRVINHPDLRQILEADAWARECFKSQL